MRSPDCNGARWAHPRDAKAVGLPAADSYTMRDVLRHATYSTGGTIAATVPGESVAMFRVSDGGKVLSTSPSVPVLPVSVPPAYPGSDLLLAVPGEALPVTAGIRNDGVTPLRNITMTLHAPAGWTVEPGGSATVGTLDPDLSATSS